MGRFLMATFHIQKTDMLELEVLLFLEANKIHGDTKTERNKS
jgi:hypothetical protein